MSNRGKTFTTRYPCGQAVILGLVLLALHFSASAQQTPGPTPMAFGQTVQGAVSSSHPIDVWTFKAKPGQAYFIKATSPDIPLLSVLTFVFPAGGGSIEEQRASVSRPGQTVGYFGVLNDFGQYDIRVTFNPQPFASQQPAGKYTLSLTAVAPQT
jgi:hypothetical protein